MTVAPPSASPSAPPSLLDRVTGRVHATRSDHAVVVLHDVTMRYPNGKEALKDVDLVVPEGDFVFLVGPSGAGKSTIMKLLIRDELATQRRSSSWTATTSPGSSAAWCPGCGARSGSCSRTSSCCRARPCGRTWRSRSRSRGRRGTGSGPSVDRVLALVGLTAQAAQYPTQLSGGEQQRTAIARALVHDPRIIIADEPTGNLDPVISWEIIQLLLRINELGVTILMATHDAEVVTALRKRVVALEDGRVIRDETGAAYHRED